MGQYYAVVNLDKKEYYYPSGLKMMEHSYKGNKTMNFAEYLLSNRWKGDRICWAGDYGDCRSCEDDVLYNFENSYLKIKLKKINKSLIKECKYVTNITLREAINIETKKLNIESEYKYENKIIKFRIHPLSILLSDGCGRGGGDFLNVDMYEDFVGRWKGHSIAVVSEMPEDFTLITPNFTENT